MNKEQLITVYAYLTTARIYRKRGKWILDTPGDETPEFNTSAELLEYIRSDLEYIKDCIEPELYEEAVTFARS